MSTGFLQPFSVCSSTCSGVVQLSVIAALSADLAYSMQHCRVVAPAEKLADLRQAFLGQLLGEVHRHLARSAIALGRRLLYMSATLIL